MSDTIQIKLDNIEVTHDGVYEATVKKYGSGAHIVFPKKHTGKQVYIAIKKEN